MNIACNDDRLIELLMSEDHENTSDTAAHLEHCARCQSRMEALAADPVQWQMARELISSVAQNGSTPRQPDNVYGTDGDEQEGGLADDERYLREWKERQEQTTSWTESMCRSLLSPASHPEMLGSIGRYSVERLIGSGGMGVVFKAHDSELNRPVAVKLLAPYLANNGSARQRFAREGRAAAAVVDEHVVPIHNVESESDHPFLVMKYIAGGSLQQRLDSEGPLDAREVLRIGMQTAKGLAAAHAQGLIHRDVKPSNILLDEGVERALLTDFGLARASDDANLTRSGFHPGTPHYMSPEQIRGEAIDARSDLFGLGCVLYSLCTGHPPFRSETSYAVLRRITDDEPRSIREINPDIPDWLDQIVLKLLAKTPDDRFASANEVASLLEGCLAHVQQPATESLPRAAKQLAQSGVGENSMASARLFGGGFFRNEWLLTALAMLPLLLLAGAIIVLELGKGTLKIETNSQHEVPIRITQNGEVVDELTVTKTGVSVKLKAGNYVVEVEGGADSYEIAGDQVTLKRGGEWIANVTHSTTTTPATASRAKLQGTEKNTPAGGGGEAEYGSGDSDHARSLMAQQTVESNDRNDNGLMDRDEAPLGLRKSFDEIDTNKDGAIDKQELTLRYMQSSGMIFTGKTTKPDPRFATPESLMKHFADCQFRGDTPGCIECYSDSLVNSFAVSTLMTAQMLTSGMLEDDLGGEMDEEGKKNVEKMERLLARSLKQDTPAIASAGLLQATKLYHDGFDAETRDEMTPEEGVLIASTGSMLKDPRQFVLDFNAIGGDDEAEKKPPRQRTYLIKHVDDKTFASESADSMSYELKHINGRWWIHDLADDAADEEEDGEAADTNSESATSINSSVVRQGPGPHDTKPVKHSATMTMKPWSINVADRMGVPIVGAKIHAWAVRSKQGGHWMWPTETAGEAPTAITGEGGTAEIKVPSHVGDWSELEKVVKVSVTVTHPEYVIRDDEYGLKKLARVKLQRGHPLTITAVDNSEEPKPVAKFGVYARDDNTTAARWALINGELTTATMAAEGETFLLASLDDRKPRLFSDEITVGKSTLNVGKIQNVRLSPGVHVSGILDEKVPRPIVDGRVLVGVRFHDSNDLIWYDFVDVEDDGSFEFDSLPRGSQLQLMAYSKGWHSVPDAGDGLNVRDIHDSKIQTTIVMAKSATLDVLVLDADEKPVTDIAVYVWPNQQWFDCRSVRAGRGFRSVEYMKSELNPDFEVPEHPYPWKFHNVKTDSSGRATLRNMLTTGYYENVYIESDEYVLKTDKSAGYEAPPSVFYKPGGSHKITLHVHKPNAAVEKTSDISK